MFTILGADGKEYGPVTAGKMHEWIAGGRANLQSKARRSGETEWKTLGDFPEFGEFGARSGGPAGTQPPPIPPATPETADANPAAVTAPAATTAPATPATADELIARAGKIDVFDCLTKSFELWKNNFFPLVGVTLLVLVVEFVLGMIPLLGFFSRILLQGVFYGGLYYYYLGKVRGEPREVGDAFAGFSRALAPLMLASLITVGITLAVMLPFFFPLITFFINAVMHHNGTTPEFTPLMIVSFFLGFLVLLYLSISWTFTFMLVIDRGLGPWTAMEVSRRAVGRQWFHVFFVMFFGGIMTMLGLIGLVIGIFFTLPLMFGAAVYAYEAMFNPPSSPPSA